MTAELEDKTAHNRDGVGVVPSNQLEQFIAGPYGKYVLIPALSKVTKCSVFMTGDSGVDRISQRCHQRLEGYHETFALGQVHELAVDRAAHQRMRLAVGSDHVLDLLRRDMRALGQSN